MESIDPDMNELKEIVKRQGVVIDDMNRTLHGMRRAQRLAVFWKVLWWAVIFLASAGAYYYYILPYINTILEAYQSAQHGVQQAQSLPQVVSDIFKKMFEQFGALTSPSITTPNQ